MWSLNCPHSTPHKKKIKNSKKSKQNEAGDRKKVAEEQPTLHMHFFCLLFLFIFSFFLAHPHPLQQSLHGMKTNIIRVPVSSQLVEANIIDLPNHKLTHNHPTTILSNILLLFDLLNSKIGYYSFPFHFNWEATSSKFANMDCYYLSIASAFI